jgi:hypothetical protein
VSADHEAARGFPAILSALTSPELVFYVDEILTCILAACGSGVPSARHDLPYSTEAPARHSKSQVLLPKTDLQGTD